MKKTHYIILGGVLLLTSSAFMIWKFNSKKNGTPSELSTNIVEQLSDNKEKSNEEEKKQEEKKFPVNAEIKSLTYSEAWDASPDKKAIDIKIDYLFIENKNNVKEIDNLNQLLKEEAQKRFDDVKDRLKEYLKEYKENENKRKVNYDTCYICEDTSEITKNNENGIISFESSNFWFAGGVACVSYNSSVLDCNTGKKLNIFDVIQGDEIKIREMIGKEIDKSEWANSIRESGREPGHPIEGPYFSDMFTILGFGDNGNSLYDLKNQPFYLKDKCLVIDFSKYDIAAGCYGAPSFDFYYDTIKKYGFMVDSKFD